jgi:magnesium-transporting ATPase (P-type)
VIEQFCDWLSRTALSVAFQNAAWFVPAVQTVHIISIAILLVSVYLIGFKLLGFMGTSTPLGSTTQRSMPWIWISLLVLLFSGTLLTITEPARELLNWVFRTKMILVLVLALLLALVQRGVRRDPGYWADSAARRSAARVLGGAMLLIGAGIITAGRWIAYV